MNTELTKKIEAAEQRKIMPLIMGVVNLTPDSFYQGSRVAEKDVLSVVEGMQEQGVDLIDIGGESTAPKSVPTSLGTELKRLIPAIKLIKEHFSIPISVDTSQASVMQQALDLGVEMINDVRAFCMPGALDIVKDYDAQLCLMHMAFHERTEHDSSGHNNKEVVDVVKGFFHSRLTDFSEHGIKRRRLLIDPGFGAKNFGKSMHNNLYLLQQLKFLQEFDLPILVGVSRKTFIRDLLKVSAEDALYGSLAATVVAVQNGATVIRTHDVKATREAVQMAYAISQEDHSGG